MAIIIFIVVVFGLTLLFVLLRLYVYVPIDPYIVV